MGTREANRMNARSTGIAAISPLPPARTEPEALDLGPAAGILAALALSAVFWTAAIAAVLLTLW